MSACFYQYNKRLWKESIQSYLIRSKDLKKLVNKDKRHKMPIARRSAKEHFRFEKSCKFIGSLAVSLLKGEERQAFVNEKLLEMKDVGKGIPVIIYVTDEGIKILNEEGTAVKMAHGITRVLFSTCHPDRRLFAYVVKAPGINGKIVTQAHMFKTSKAKHTQELSSSISRAFKIGYSRNTIKRENRVGLFEKEAEESKEVRNVQKKRWARNEMAHGHDNSAHALRAKGQSSSIEGPSKAMQKLVEKMGNEAELDKAIVQNESRQYEKSRKSSEPNNVNLKHRKISDPDGLLQSGKILPESGKTFESKRRLSDTRGRKLSKQKTSFALPEINNNSDPFDVDPTISEIGNGGGKPNEKPYVPSNVDNESTSCSDLRSISQAWYEGMEPPDEETASPNNFLQPIMKFGTLCESALSLDVASDEQASPRHEYINFDSAKSTPAKPPRRNRSRKKLLDIPASYRMTLTEDQILKDSEWFQPGFSRSIAEEILQNRPIGAFFIRDSSSHPGNFVMTIKVSPEIKGTGVMNYLIVRDQDGLYHIKGFSAYFPGLTYLVAHYSSIQEDISCRLHLSSDNPLFRVENEGVGDQSDGMDLDDLFDEDECGDEDYINFSSNIDICRELDELCFSED